MTEYDLLIHYVPLIAKMTVDSRQLTDDEYLDWKQESLKMAPEQTKKFVKKVLYVIDKYR